MGRRVSDICKLYARLPGPLKAISPILFLQRYQSVPGVPVVSTRRNRAILDYSARWTAHGDAVPSKRWLRSLHLEQSNLMSTPVSFSFSLRGASSQRVREDKGYYTFYY